MTASKVQAGGDKTFFASRLFCYKCLFFKEQALKGAYHKGRDTCVTTHRQILLRHAQSCHFKAFFKPSSRLPCGGCPKVARHPNSFQAS